MSDIKNYETLQEFGPELKQAIQFDIRDNPGVRDIINFLTVKYGKDGEAQFLKIVEDDVRREFSGEAGPLMFPWTRAAVKTYITGGELHAQFGMGQIAALVGGVLTALAQVGSAVYTSKLAANTQLKITKLQVQQAQSNNDAQAALLQKQIDAQQASLNAQTAQKAATGNLIPGLTTPQTPQVATSSMFGDTGTMLMMAGLAVGVGYIIVTKLRN